MTKLILKLFFLLPIWVLKIVTMRKKILVNGQILDYQTQILLALQSLQPDNFDLTESGFKPVLADNHDAVMTR